MHSRTRPAGVPGAGKVVMHIVHSMDRLAHNVEDMLKLVREMNNRDVSAEFIKGI